MSLCDQCGGACCKTLLIANATQPASRWLARTRGVAVEGGVLISSRCRHLDKTGRCRIYANRPQECRDYEPGGRACALTRAYCLAATGGI